MKVLYSDAHYVAVDKPAGLLVHRSGVDRHETRFAMQMLRDQLGQWVYPVHRLDKCTSGVLLFALSPDAARRAGDLFTGGRVAKRYLAVVRGYLDEEGVIDYALAEPVDAMTDARARVDKGPQHAVTRFTRLATAELPQPVGRYATARYSLAELMPYTGRKHQIRRHLKHVFHPVIGDTTYGDGRHNRFFRSKFHCDRLLLAARSLTFSHPYSGSAVTVEAPLDPAFTRVLQQLGWEDAVCPRTADARSV